MIAALTYGMMTVPFLDLGRNDVGVNSIIGAKLTPFATMANRYQKSGEMSGRNVNVRQGYSYHQFPISMLLLVIN